MNGIRGMKSGNSVAAGTRRRSSGVGVLGGSFNPVHNGHLHIASAVREAFQLAEVHFVVATNPPHKSERSLLPLAHRYAMVCLATSGVRAFVPSLLELDPPASPFSIDTLGKMTQTRSVAGRDVVFIAGMDSLLELKTWRNSQALLETYSFVFVGRPGFSPPPVEKLLPAGTARLVVDLRGLGPASRRKKISACRAAQENRIYLADIGAPDISASTIRQRVRSGSRYEHLLPAPVNAYIKKLHLYGE